MLAGETRWDTFRYDVNHIFDRMARSSIAQAGFVIVCITLFVPNAQPRARYSMPSPRLIQKSLTPIYYELYLQCPHQICPDSKDYPEEQILHLMKNTKNMQGFFGIVLNSTYDATDIASRSNFFRGRVQNLCDPESPQTHTPRVLRNVHDEWKFVVNVDGFNQRFIAEMCRNNVRSRAGKSNDYCSEFGAKCKQNHQEVYLLTYENGFIDFDKFRVPTTCNCDCT
ncbi:unnamed protein product [Phyllotreta striolata]|uniref:Spaetzle domain-containing protein n=1 Tax=Phyllotreta striolata TaxID=444603 RepID=A0A9N9TU00_PHYSR|nr:unnamed protein product [Phyllotreta striolata]